MEGKGINSLAYGIFLLQNQCRSHILLLCNSLIQSRANEDTQRTPATWAKTVDTSNIRHMIAACHRAP